MKDFRASDGWLSNFQHRYHISMQAVCGELNKVNEDVVNERLCTFDSVKKKKNSRIMIFLTLTRVEFFFNLFPQRTLSVIGDNNLAVCGQEIETITADESHEDCLDDEEQLAEEDDNLRLLK